MVTLAISSAWLLRANDGAVLYEAYYWVTRPLQPGISREEQFESSYILELQQRIVELEYQIVLCKPCPPTKRLRPPEELGQR